MIRLRLLDQLWERRALGYLAGRFSFTSFADGLTLVSELALPALMREHIPFSVDGQASYECPGNDA